MSDVKPKFDSTKVESETDELKDSDDKSAAKSVLVATARKLFSLHGFQGTSTRDIAKDSGLNISLISYYFGGKEGLYREVFLQFGLKIQSVVNDTLESFKDLEMNEKNFTEEIKLIVKMFVDLQEQNKDMSTLLWREKIEGMPHSKDVHETIFGPIGEKMFSFIAQAQKRGIVSKKIHPKVFFICMIESIMGYLRAMQCEQALHLHDDCLQMPKDRDAIVEQITTYFTKGILK